MDGEHPYRWFCRSLPLGWGCGLDITTYPWHITTSNLSNLYKKSGKGWRTQDIWEKIIDRWNREERGKNNDSIPNIFRNLMFVPFSSPIFIVPSSLIFLTLGSTCSHLSAKGTTTYWWELNHNIHGRPIIHHFVSVPHETIVVDQCYW